MNPQQQFCPNTTCHASGREGRGNIVIHSRKDRRYKCKCCGKTFSETKGTAVSGIKKPVSEFVQVVTLLAYGCPVQAIVAAFGLAVPATARTVSRICLQPLHLAFQFTSPSLRWLSGTATLGQAHACHGCRAYRPSLVCS